MVNVVFFKHSHTNVGAGRRAFSSQMEKKLFKIRINFKKVIIILVALFLHFNDISTACMSSLCEMMVYRERAESNVIEILFSGILPRLFIFLMKSVESLK